MAPKRKRGPPKVTTVKFEGDAEELARLLAWLDLKKEFRIEREIFKTRIVEYFRKRHHRDYTWDSVDNILHSIHNKGHRDDNIKWTNRRMMLEEGTACLVVQDRHKWLDETTVLALEISEQLKLDESFRTEFIQSTGFRNTSATMSRERSLVSPSRSLRSRSANAGTDPSNGHEVEPIANRQRLVPVRARQGRLASESSSVSIRR